MSTTMAGKQRMQALPAATVRLLGSTQVITSVFSVVKELVENALDSEATIIEVKLEKNGLDKIEVKDNGSGISAEDVPLLARHHCTSKITSHGDLSHLLTFGFRGEALASLAAVADLSVTTKTAEDAVGHTYFFSASGEMTDSKPSHLGQGTTVSVSNLFRGVPVRRQILQLAKTQKEDMKKVQELLCAYGAIFPSLRVSMYQNAAMAWQKAPMTSRQAALSAVMGHKVASKLLHQEKCQDEVKVEIFLPKPGSDTNITSRSTPNGFFTVVNDRPVTVPDLEKLVRQYFSNCHGCESTRYPLFYLSVRLPAEQVDVNLDPNKTRVLLQPMDLVKELLTDMLLYVYGPLDNPPVHWRQQSRNSKQGTTEEILDAGNSSALDKFSHGSGADMVGKETVCVEEHNGGAIEEQDKRDADLAKMTAKTQNSSSVARDERDPPSTVVSSTVPDTPSIIADAPTSCDVPVSCAAPTTTVLDEDIICIPPESAVTSLSSGSADKNHTDKVAEVQVVLERPAVTGEAMEVCSTAGTSAVCGPNGASSSLEKSGLDSSAWAKGIALMNAGGKVIQPVTLMPPSASSRPGKRPHSELSEEEPQSKIKAFPAKHVMQGRQSTFDLIGNQRVRRPESPFTLFSKDRKRQVVDENPEAGYEEVTELLQQCWEELSPAERAKFETQHLRDTERYEAEVMSRTKLRSKALKTVLNKTPVSVRDQLAGMARIKSDASSDIRCLQVDFGLLQLKARLLQDAVQSAHAPWRLVGPLGGGGAWLCRGGAQLLAVNPHRLSERLLYQQLCDTHCVPSTTFRLPQPLPNLNDKCLKALRKLAGIETGCVDLPDLRLVKNGFMVRCHITVGPYEEEQFSAELTGMSHLLREDDLVTLLEAMHHTGGKMTLADSRPLAVRHYLEGEAVRMARQGPLQRSHSDMEELLERLLQLYPDCTDLPAQLTCLHGHNIFLPLDVDLQVMVPSP